MTSIERVDSIFKRMPVDAIPAGEEFWSETLDKWRKEGFLGPDESPIEHFDLDLDRSGLPIWFADPSFGNRILEEDEDTVAILDGNGATLRQHKHHASTPEHIRFQVADRDSWEAFAKPHLTDVDIRRLDIVEYKRRRQRALDIQRYFSNDSFGPFELMQRLVGHEVLLLSMALDPDWIKDMVLAYTEFNIMHFEELFAAAEIPQSTWIADDLGYKYKPFMSPAMFKEILKPGYIRLFDFLHARGIKTILHSCGFIEPLLPDLIDAGLDCYEAIEAKAGTDIRALVDKYGQALVFFGNMDIRTLETNREEEVLDELESKIRYVQKKGGAYILHSDHSISPRVEYDTYKYFLEKGRALAAHM